AMHHCVATYFEKRNSFILSVRQDGVRIATVELDIHDFSIQQCRAACNEKPQRYDEICEIINSHRYLFAQAIKKA
ncbi:MAG: PcfJ domain-containing protein, partial [Bacteroidales bacterium]|nr:PcfJ domain-containing protein [Bacteroidales bacterium]